MLDSRILGMDYGSSYGSGALKALQNDNIPELDLLVREAIQNSSDASLSEPGDSFAVNFNFGTFNPYKLNRNFEDVSDILNRRYPEESADYLEIRDYKTSGLTGNIRKSEIDPEDHGNYFKLVFDTGKEQTNSEGGLAGGSWGYGKSVYFRVGMGLVIFYSRIAVEGGFESRLIAALIEHENAENAILTEIKSNAIGRAWWGRRDSYDETELLPITNEKEIEEIINIFGVHPFTGNTTGTSIIIPYIDKKRLLDGIFPEHCGISDDIISMCTFKDDIVKYTQLAVQKWYAPKIFNKNLKNYSNQKWLAVRVNDTPIRYEDMRPFFQLVQELYTSALSANKCGRQDYQSTRFEGIRTVAIPSAKVVGGKAGYVSTIKIRNENLSTTSSVIPLAAYLRIFGGNTLTDPITMFARAAGMILDYKSADKWAQKIRKPEDEKEQLISFFVPDCESKLKIDDTLGEYSGISLGEYLRSCEKSDHMDWNDKSNITIVTNLASRLCEKINDCYKPKEDGDSEGSTSRLSGRLGRRLLPTKNYGKNKGGSGGAGSGGSGGSISNLDFKILNQYICDNSISIEFELTFKNIRKEAFIGVFVESEVGLMDAKAWEEGIKTEYPITIPAVNNCKTYSVNSAKTVLFDRSCTYQETRIENDYSTIELIYTENGNVRGIKVVNGINNVVVSGTMVLVSSDRKYCCTVKESKE